MLGPGRQRIYDLESRMRQEQEKIEKIKLHACSLFKHGKMNEERLMRDYFDPLLEENARAIESLLQKNSISLVRSWDEEKFWQEWKPEAELDSLIRIGAKLEQRLHSAYGFKVPHFAPFIGENKTIVICCNGNTAEQGKALLQSLVIRTAFMLPHQSRYTLLDPAGNGAAFPMRKNLPLVRESGDDVRRELDEVIKDIRRINENLLDAESDSFELVQEEIRINERFEFIFAADFPNQYDRRAIEGLQSVGNTGPRTGKYLFIHHNQAYPLPRDMNMNAFENAVYIDMDSGYGGSDRSLCNLKFIPDEPPSPPLQRELFEKLSQSKPPERKLDWDDIVCISEIQWWTQTAEKIIETPVGGSGSSGTLNIWFGKNNEGRPCAHGMLGAMTGAGKSNLYHVLILGLATRYSPEELRIYLIDGKDGVEFQPYRHLSHVEVVSLRSPAELSRSILAELIQEKERRNVIFGKVGASDFPTYRDRGQPKGKLARILLLVDEYQELFMGDKDGIASEMLLQLAGLGRSAGIHMLLASQRFGVPGMMYQTDIFGNVHMRMAMQMSDSDRQSLTEFGRRGKQLIMTCDLPGKIVVNDRAGDDGLGANKIGKVAFLKPQRREEIIRTLTDKAHRNISPNNLPSTVIFDGKAQPNIVENPQLMKILERPIWMTPKEWQDVARQLLYEGGLNIPDWLSAERPKVMWLGQEFSVRGQAMTIVRRRSAENVLIVGSHNPTRYGMLASILISLAVNADPRGIQFMVLDRSMAETEWCNTLQNVCELVLKPAGFSLYFTRDSRNTAKLVNTLLERLKKRSKLSDDQRLNQPSIFAIMTELDLVDEIRRQVDEYGDMTDSPLSQELQRILIEGPRLGIHLILSFSGLRPATNVLDERRGLINFRHRIALQMSEDDSFTLMRGRGASELQKQEPIPICALYRDEENDKNVRFKPYSIEADLPFEEQLQQVQSYLVNWKEKLVKKLNNSKK